MVKHVLWLCAAILLLTSAKPKNNEMTLNVASFNLRYNNPGDKENAWPNRKGIATDFIKKQKLDIFGIQEGLHDQLVDIKTMTSDYEFIGVGRADGKEEGEYSAIFYNKTKFKPVVSNTFWLNSDTTAVGVKGWDGACERVVTWALMEEIKTGKRFYFFNTHFDHVGKEARVNSSELLISKVKEKGSEYPIIVTGDFNATPESNVYTILTKSEGTPLIDSRSIAKKISGPEWTFHSFGKSPIERRGIIDYIFVTAGVEVLSYESCFEDHNGVYLSDHNPIVVTIKTKK